MKMTTVFISLLNGVVRTAEFFSLTSETGFYKKILIVKKYWITILPDHETP